jgi:hypothetical protein
MDEKRLNKFLNESEIFLNEIKIDEKLEMLIETIENTFKELDEMIMPLAQKTKLKKMSGFATGSLALGLTNAVSKKKLNRKTTPNPKKEEQDKNMCG